MEAVASEVTEKRGDKMWEAARVEKDMGKDKELGRSRPCLVLGHEENLNRLFNGFGPIFQTKPVKQLGPDLLVSGPNNSLQPTGPVMQQ